MEIDGLDHLVLTVASLSDTSAWYARVLGFEVRESDGRRSLHFGRQKLNLHERGREFEPKAARPTPGSADLCFIARDDATAIALHLRERDVAIEVGPVAREGALGLVTSVYVRDPDGNLIEIATYA